MVGHLWSELTYEKGRPSFQQPTKEKYHYLQLSFKAKPIWNEKIVFCGHFGMKKVVPVVILV